MYAEHHPLLQFCNRHPDALRRAQVLIDVDNESVVGTFTRGRFQNRITHDLLIQLFDLQVAYEFMLSVNWVPAAKNAVADAISRPSRNSTLRLAPGAFRRAWGELSTNSIDLMACTASSQRFPLTGAPLPLFSRYDCAGSLGLDVLARDVAVLSGTTVPAFGFCPPPPVMVGHVVHCLAEYGVHEVVFCGGHQSVLVSVGAVRSSSAPTGGSHKVRNRPWPSRVLFIFSLAFAPSRLLFSPQ